LLVLFAFMPLSLCYLFCLHVHREGSRRIPQKWRASPSSLQAALSSDLFGHSEKR
jgi:hypothetical protein